VDNLDHSYWAWQAITVVIFIIQEIDECNKNDGMT